MIVLCCGKYKGIYKDQPDQAGQDKVDDKVWFRISQKAIVRTGRSTPVPGPCRNPGIPGGRLSPVDF